MSPKQRVQRDRFYDWAQREYYLFRNDYSKRGRTPAEVVVAARSFQTLLRDTILKRGWADFAQNWVDETCALIEIKIVEPLTSGDPEAALARIIAQANANPPDSKTGLLAEPAPEPEAGAPESNGAHAAT